MAMKGVERDTFEKCSHYPRALRRKRKRASTVTAVV
jgi:hypothetical protein